MNNLMVNAVRYNRPGGEIYLTVSGRKLTVSNTSDEPALDGGKSSTASTVRPKR